VKEQGVILEHDFDRIFCELEDNTADQIGQYDNCPPKTYGKALNDMSIHMQRALVLNHENLLSRWNVSLPPTVSNSSIPSGPSVNFNTTPAPGPVGKKRKKAEPPLVCANYGCSTVLYSAARGTGWVQCEQHPETCALRFCKGKKLCHDVYKAHLLICKEKKKKRQSRSRVPRRDQATATKKNSNHVGEATALDSDNDENFDSDVDED
jgi:hypothetical protein